MRDLRHYWGSDKDHCTGVAYPNGIKKSRLLEIFLSVKDFDTCTPEDYEFDVYIARRAEAHGEHCCAWYRNRLGRFIVDGLRLKDNKVVEILPDGFRVVSMKKQVFISYGLEDRYNAVRIARHLERMDVKVWIDLEIPGGKTWATEIENAIEQSDRFITVLSPGSVTKCGYVNVELQHALRIQERLPEGVTYVVPVRLAECQPPYGRLRALQWVDVFPNWRKGVQKLVRALDIDRGR